MEVNQVAAGTPLEAKSPYELRVNLGKDVPESDVRTALAAYHAGQGNVDEWRREGGGIRFPETRQYVDRVLSARRVYTDVYGPELGG